MTLTSKGGVGERMDVPELDPEALHGRLPAWAEAHGVHLVEGTLAGAGLVCVIDPDVLGLESFCALAGRAGVPFLYVAASRFDGVLMDDEEACAGSWDRRGRARLAALAARASAGRGRCYELRVQFVVQGVVHTWIAEAPWHGALQGDLEELEDDYAQQAPATPEDAPSTPEEVDRIAALLVALPAFREATKNPERERILLREHPQLRSSRHSGLSRLGYDALEEARLCAADAAKKAYADFGARVPELVGEIVESGALDAATSAPARKAAIRRYLAQHSGGYPPARDFVELLHGEPLLKKPRKAPVVPGGQDL